MAKSNTSIQAVSGLFPAVPGFDANGWIKLAQMLVGQDLALAPSGSAAPSSSSDLIEAADTSQKMALSHASGLAMVQNWEALGFVLSRSDVLAICALDPSAHAWMDKSITPALTERLGGHVKMKPMYPNFPSEVMKMTDADLLYNAVVHYMGDWLGVRMLPYTDEKPRSSLPKKDVRARALRLVDLGGLREELSRFYSMNTVWTPSQVELAKHALPLAQHWSLFGPATALPQRENQARLTGVWLSQVESGELVAPLTWPANRVSATDILRAAVAYSGGDPCLASSSEKVRFARFTRPMRRICLQALETAIDTTRDPLTELHAHRQSWLRLAERIHASEMTKQFPRACELLAQLRNEPAPVSWNGHLDAHLSSPPEPSSVAAVLELIPQSPGLSARALTRLLSWASKAPNVEKRVDFGARLVEAFAQVSDRVDTPVLLSLEASLLADVASGGNRERVMLPKGQAAWRYRVPAHIDRKHAPSDIFAAAASVCESTLLARFSQLPDLGKFYVEPGLDGILVPKGLRSSSSNVCAATRGSRVPVGKDAKTIRLFLWWNDTDTGRVDVDLSGVGVDDRFRSTETCNYHGLHQHGMVHSGDLTSAPNGAAEFIDVRLDKLDARTRYVVLTANVYSGPGFNKIPDCFVGWQERNSESAQRGDIMELRSVVEKFPVTASSKGFLAAAFDVNERKLVWLDLPIKTQSYDSIHASHSEVSDVLRDFELYAFGQPTIGRLVQLHAAARNGKQVLSPGKADTVFSVAPYKAEAGQKVICALQPQSVASELMVSASASVLSLASEKVAEISAQSNPLDDILAQSIEQSAKKEKVPVKAKKTLRPR